MKLYNEYSYRPDEERLSEIEKTWGVRLPKEIRISLMKDNGGISEKRNFPCLYEGSHYYFRPETDCFRYNFSFVLRLKKVTRFGKIISKIISKIREQRNERLYTTIYNIK